MRRRKYSVIVFTIFLVLLSSEIKIFAQSEGDVYMIDKIKNVKQSVVKVICKDLVSSGSGFVATADGYIITNFHVVGTLDFDQTHAKILPKYSNDVYVRFNNGEEVNAKVVVDSNDIRPIIFDYCILKIPKNNLKHLNFGSFKDSQEGSSIYFCGYPFGKNFHTTHKGMMSSKHAIDSRFKLNGKKIKYNILQIDGSVNKGNSGGPLLLYDNNRVIGIVSMREGSITQGLEQVRNFIEESNKHSTGSVYISGVNPIPVLKELIDVLDAYISVGIGFAISIEYAKEHLEELLSKNKK